MKKWREKYHFRAESSRITETMAFLPLSGLGIGSQIDTEVWSNIRRRRLSLCIRVTALNFYRFRC